MGFEDLADRSDKYENGKMTNGKCLAAGLWYELCLLCLVSSSQDSSDENRKDDTAPRHQFQQLCAGARKRAVRPRSSNPGQRIRPGGRSRGENQPGTRQTAKYWLQASLLIPDGYILTKVPMLVNGARRVRSENAAVDF